MVRSLRVLATLAALLLVVVLLARFVSIDVLREPIAQQLSSAIGRPVRVDGPIHIDIGLNPHIELGEVRVSELPGDARIGRVELEFNLPRLLFGEVDIGEIGVFDGEIHFQGADAPESEVPPEAPASAAGGLRFNVSRFEARELRVEYTSSAGLVMTVDLERLSARALRRGAPIAVEAVGVFEGIAFDVSAELGALEDLANSPAPYPVSIAGSLDGMRFTATGSVGRPAELSELEFDLALAAPDLASIGALAGRELPEIGPVRASARLSDSDGTLGLEEISVRIGDPEDAFNASVAGEIDDFDRLDEIDIRLDLKARDLLLIGQLLGEAGLPYVAPVSLEGSFRGSDERLTSQSFTLRLRDTIVHGTLSGSLVPGRRPSLEAQLESPVVYLADVGIEPAPDDPRTAGPDADGWSLDSPLPLGALPEADLRIEVRADQVLGHAGFEIDAFRARLVVTEDHAAIEDAEAVFEGGTLTGAARVEAGVSPPRASLHLRGTNIRLYKLMAQIEDEPSLSGVLDVSLDLTSRGDSLRELTSNLEGTATLVVREGEARSSYARALERDLLRAALGSSDPGEFDSVRCFIGDFRIEDGVADVQTLWFETERAVVYGEGRLDLRSYEYDLKLVSEPKQRSLLGVAAQVRVTGPFSDPKIRASKRSLATSAAKGLLEGLTRPTQPVWNSMLDTFWKREGKRGPCAGFAEPDS